MVVAPSFSPVCSSILLSHLPALVKFLFFKIINGNSIYDILTEALRSILHQQVLQWQSGDHQGNKEPPQGRDCAGELRPGFPVQEEEREEGGAGGQILV